MLNKQMMKRIGLLCIGFAILFIPGILLIYQPVTAATTITVNIATDTLADDGMCSLREAIIAANTDNPFNGCTGGSGTDTIEFAPTLPAPTAFLLTITGKNEDSALSGDLDITQHVIISGLGESRTFIDGNNTDRVFEVHMGKHLTMSGVTVQHGNPGAGINGGGLLVWGWLTLNNSTITGNQGSGISNDAGLVELSDVQVNDNSGDYGIRNEAGATLTFNGGTLNNNSGGGLYNVDSTATLSNLTISNNSNGSGVYSVATSPTRINIDHTDILTNTTTANGGGIYNSGNQANALITTSRISGNQANAVGGGAGGGVYNNGIMTLDESAIDNNEARTGGGIEHSGANLYLTNDTISNNRAADDGGGLYNRGNAILTNITFNANSAGTGSNIFNDEALMAMGNSIVAGGTCLKSGGSLTSQGHNLDSGNSCGFTAAGDMVNTDPLLGVLQANGGPTPTHALNSGSPAIDHGDNGMCPATDQRGVARPQGGNCDMGAYEAGGTAVSTDLAISVMATPALVSVSAPLTYTLSITNLGTVPAGSVIVTDTFPAEVSYVDSSAGGGGVCQYAGLVTCTLSSLAAGDVFTVIVVVNTPGSAGEIINQAAVSADVIDINPENNVVMTTTIVHLLRKLYLPLVINK